MAVAPAHQGKGLGSKLLTWFCSHADSDELPAYLETSKVENKRLYERFGFSVRSEAEAVGVPHWFMWREPT
jgi:ribosomal protein S18 acetylase RimI-like enzyme